MIRDIVLMLKNSQPISWQFVFRACAMQVRVEAGRLKVPEGFDLEPVNFHALFLFMGIQFHWRQAEMGANTRSSLNSFGKPKPNPP